MATYTLSDGGTASLARGLGWFSIGLGLTELLAPKELARMLGMPKRSGLVRMMGLREIASGIGILAQRRPVGALWSRVGGDVMDLGVLGTALAVGCPDRGVVAAATAAVAGVTALDVMSAQKLSQASESELDGAQKGIHVESTVTIDRSRDDLYAFWRDFENLPSFMTHLESVHVQGEQRSHWVAKGPAGMRVEWDAEIIEERSGELIRWRSLPGSDVDTAGSVRFERAPGNRGTIVRATLDYNPPGGVVGATIARLMGEAPEKQVPVELRRFKQLMETGDIIRTEGQPAGRRSSTSALFDDFLRK